MNQATQIDGERLAKVVAERAEALEQLRRLERSHFPWYLNALMAGMGALCGWNTAMWMPNGHEIIAAVAGAALMFSAVVFREANIARRRIDALLILLKANGTI
jgi:hypothetical protein